MKSKLLYSLAGAAAAGGATFLLMSLDLGPDITPLAKFFLVFFGALVALQIIPALVLFVCMFKELLAGVGNTTDDNVLAESQSDNRFP